MTAEKKQLSEEGLEALAHGRRDLAGEDAVAAAEDADLAALVEREREASRDASVALKRAAPELPDLDAMIARAMAKLPEPVPAPSRKSLWIGAALGAGVAIASGVASLTATSDPRTAAQETFGSVTAIARLALTLGTALDRAVAHLPGGWATVALASLVVVAMLLVPLRAMAGPLRARELGATVGMLLVLAVGGTAHAYDLEGRWPAVDPRVSVDVDRTPLSQALRQALEPAGLGLAYTLDDDPIVTLHVREAPLREVLDALLADVPARVRHTGHLLVIRPPAAAPTSGGDPDEEEDEDDDDDETAQGRSDEILDPFADDPPGPGVAVVVAPPMPAPPLPPSPPLPPLPAAPPTLPFARTPPQELRDLVTFGGDARVLPDHQVRDVVTMGGDATIEGRAYGNVVTMGGDVDVATNGVVVGDVVTMGGDIRVARGGLVHGQLNAMGGDIEVIEPLSVGTPQAGAHGTFRISSLRGDDEEPQSWLARTFESAMRHALLFMLGLVIMGLAPSRFRMLQGHLVKQPLKSFGAGFLGAIAAVLLALVLVITIVGIPGAVVLVLLLFLAAYSGLAAAASVIGAALPVPSLKDRPVMQLGAGVGVLFVVSLVPAIGPLLVVAATLAGLGSVLMTRAGEQPASSIATAL
jgi:hypothetical protein